MKLWKAYAIGLGFLVLLGAAAKTIPAQLWFQCTGTGCVSRTIASKEGDWLSVKDFTGVVGDNSNDDTAGINAALLQAGLLTGATLYFPPGQYKSTTGLVVPANVRVLCAWQANTTINVTAAVWAVDFADVYDAGITNCGIVLGASALGGIRIHAGNVLTAETRITVDNTFVRASARTSGQIGYLLQADSATAGVYHNNFYNLSTDKMDIAVKFTSLVNNQGPNANYIMGLNTSGGTVGVLMQDGTDNVLTHMQFLGAFGAPTPISISLPGHVSGYGATHNIFGPFNSECGGTCTTVNVAAQQAGQTNPPASNSFIGTTNDGTQIVENSGATGNTSNRYEFTTQTIMPVITGNSGGLLLDSSASQNVTILSQLGQTNFTVPFVASKRTLLALQTTDGTPTARNMFLGTSPPTSNSSGLQSMDLFNNAGTRIFNVLDDGRVYLTAGMLAMVRVALTYSTSITPNTALGNEFVITPTDGVAFAVNAPVLPATGQRITLRVKNTFGVLGAITMNGVWKFVGAPTFPVVANGTSQAIDFQYDGTNWIQASPVTGAVPN